MIDKIEHILIPVGEGENYKFGDVKRFQPIADPKTPTGPFIGLEIELYPESEDSESMLLTIENPDDAIAAFDILTNIGFLQQQSIRELANLARTSTAGGATP